MGSSELTDLKVYHL